MNRTLHKLKTEAQKIHLSRAERFALRQRIFGTVSLAQRRSPYTLDLQWFSMRIAIPMAALLLVVLGTGTVYAAERALPGDTLYLVKVSVAEPLRGVFAFSQTAQAKFHASVAKTRMEEAEHLVSQGRLTASTTAQLEENLHEHIAAVQAITHTLAKSNPGVAEEVATTLDSSLGAHGAILARLGADSTDNDTRENSVQLALTVVAVRIPREVGAEKKEGVTVRTATSLAPALQTTSESTSAAGTAIQEEKANGQLAEVQKQFKKTKDIFSTSTTKRVEGRFQEIQRQIEAGDTTGAMRASVELSTFITAGEKFNGRLLERLIIEKDNEQDEKGRENADGSDD